MGFIDRLGPEYGPLIDDLHFFGQHSTRLFPEATTDICALVANVLADNWSDWTEIVDDPGGTTLSSKFATKSGHISAMVVEIASVADKIYVVEVAYGTPKVIVSRFRIQSETNKLPTAESPRVRARHIPAGETIYYRCMCEAANTPAESIEVHFRYFLHGE
ncbi:unnamed protein product [marine sediment metagenome]|uniref:Uncharacterized protein n=1 Tax=marine sediment metagenome TaxID=412755 RepID=X1S1Q9_9ZZZZ